MTKQPKGFYKYHIFCCTNVRHPKNSRGSCGQKGSENLRDYMKATAKKLGLKDLHKKYLTHEDINNLT